MKKNLITIKAYSLLEMAITITIIALLLSGGIGVYGKKLENSRYSITRDKMEFIDKSINSFAKNIKSSGFGFIPCPADPALDLTSANFGVSSNYNSTTGTCAFENGTVPVKTLKLPIEYAFDGWNRRFNYHTSRNLGNIIDFLNEQNLGTLSVIDYNGNEKTDINKPAPNNRGAAYILVSYGSNGFGAYIYNGSARIPSSTGTESQNSDGDSTYLQTDIRADYDDIVIYRTKSQVSKPMVNTSPILVKDTACSSASIVYNSGDPLTTTNSLNTFRNLQVSYQFLADTIYQSAEELMKICNNQTEIDFQDCSDTPTYDCLSNSILLWLDATDPNDTGSQISHNSNLASWKDKSGNNNHFNIQSGIALYQSNIIKENPAVLFNGSSYMASTNNDIMPSGNSHYSIFIAFRPTAITSNHDIFGTDFGNQSNLIRINSAGELINNWGVSQHISSSTISSNSNHVFSAVYNANYSSGDGQLNMWIDGENALTFNAPPNYNGASSINILLGGGTGNFYSGYVGEVLLYNKALSDYEREIVENYLISKWITKGSCN